MKSSKLYKDGKICVYSGKKTKIWNSFIMRMVKIFLDGIWKLRDSDGEYELDARAHVVQGALIENKVLPDPYKGSNEDLFKTIERKDWIYEKEFNIDEDLKQTSNIDLVLCGIDTIADIYFNDEHIGKTEDMFLTYRFDVVDKLRKENNILRVVIHSPITEAEKLERSYGKLNGSEDTARGYIRKAQYSFGWDWGIRLPVSGIWRSVYIESYEGRIENCTAYLKDDSICVEGDVFGKGDSIEVLLNGSKMCTIPIAQSRTFKGSFHMKDVKLWYPAGLGEQNLYDFVFLLKNEGKELYSERKPIGLRTVRVIKDDGSFIFEINGEKVFAKGANWIPCDTILTNVTPDRYRKLVEFARNANMNMLRVWGGGIYEDESFYSACDELGIMVWQDFMFSCCEYPDNLPWFRDLANREVRAMVKKLRYHPSIVLWCGNNENNWGFEEWEWNRKVDGYNLGNRLYLIDFPLICAEEDGTRPYWPSSPYGGDKANSEDSGDMHVWNVWSGWEGYESYEKNHGRFISEFGLQSFPDETTIECFESESMFDKNMLKHNKQKDGMERILRYINGEFGVVCDIHSIFYLSQMVQAEAVKRGVEHWRMNKYKTAGTLFWQLDDSWPVISWSAVDYFGRKKALCHYAKRFFANVLPVVRYDGNEADIFLVSDLRDAKRAKVSVELFRTSGELVYKKEHELVVPEDCVTPVERVTIDEPEQTVCYLSANVDGMEFENYRIFCRFRDLEIHDPRIDVVEDEDGIKLRARKPAFGVKLSCKSAEDNFFFLKPGRERRIKAKEVYSVESLYNYLSQ